MSASPRDILAGLLTKQVEELIVALGYRPDVALTDQRLAAIVGSIARAGADGLLEVLEGTRHGQAKGQQQAGH